jgi:hypothetical protein
MLYYIMNCFCLITTGIKPKLKELREVRLSASSNTINNTNEGKKNASYDRFLAKRKAQTIFK